MIKCKFTDIRNSWEMKDPIKIDGNWCDIKSLMIKTAAMCKNYCSDVVYDINWIQDHISACEEFIIHEIFYECGIHSTYEYSGEEWTEEKKLEELKKHCSEYFCILKIEFKKMNERDYELYCSIVGDERCTLLKQLSNQDL